MDRPNREHCPPHGFNGGPTWTRPPGERAACAWCGTLFEVTVEETKSYGTVHKWTQVEEKVDDK